MRKLLSNICIQRFYKIASYFLFSIFLLGFLCFYYGDQWNVFFLKGQALFSDYFNVSCIVADNNPYYNDVWLDRDKAYLPFCYIVIKLFNIGVDYNGMTPYECSQNTGAIVQAVVFGLISLVVFLFSLKKFGASNSLLVLAAISAPALFQYERGNLIMLTVACISFFLAFYNERGYKKYIGLTLFCVSMVFKVYPAILGLMLLRDKRYKDILYCICITSLLIILPFFYFEHGLDNFPVMLRNVSLNSEYFTTYTTTARYGIHAFLTLVFAKFHMLDTELFNTSLLVSKITTLILCLLSIGMFFVEKKKWKQMAFLIFPLLMFPTASHFYCGLYLIPVLLLFLKENSNRKIDYLYVVLFVISFSPLQIVIKHMSISGHMSCMAALVIWLILILDAGMQYYRDKKLSIAKSE